MRFAQPSLQRPLLVELSGSGLRHVFELAESDDRAYLVGSSRQTDFRIDRPGVAAVEFHLERVGSDAWLVPAYRGRGLRVNGLPVETSVRVDGRLTLELGSYGLELRLLPAETDVTEASRSNGTARSLPADYAHTLPTETASTAVAMKPFDLDGPQSVPTQQMPAMHGPAAVVRPQLTQRILPIRPNPLQGLQHTERLAAIAAAPPVTAQPFGGALLETQRLAPVTAPVPVPPPAARTLPVAIRAIEVAPLEPPSVPGPLVAQETTCFDIAAVAIGTLEVAPTASPEPAALPRPVPIKKVDRSRSLLGASSMALVTQLGTLAKERPGLVVGGGLVAALVLALALLGATRVVAPARQAAVPGKVSSSIKPPPAAAPLATASAVAKPAAPTLVVVPTPPANPKRTSKTVADPVLAAAVADLAAGRVADASRAYEALAARPEGADVYTPLAALLARRASTGCTGGSPSEPPHCPELLK